jgi:hypothetical protein
MPHKIHWLIPNRLMIVQISGDIAIEDIAEINAEIVALLDAGRAPIHIITDLKHLGKFPFDLIGVRRAATYLQHPKLGLIVAYGVARLASSFAQMLTQIAGVQLQFAHDRSEALQLLMAEDAEIKTLIETSDLPMTF